MARATALPPDERRATIIAATLPLLRLHGRAVTTSQIAMAAGVAEGTLFRVFEDKDALIAAAIAAAFDPAPTQAAIARIDRGLGLRETMIAAVEVLQQRIAQLWQLIAMLGLPPPPTTRPPPPAWDEALRDELLALLEPHRGALRCEVEHAVRLMRALAFAGTHPRMTDRPLTAHEVVAVLLDGVRARDEEEP